MPLLRRKSVALIPLPDQVLNGDYGEHEEVFYLKATGEIFLDYE